MIFQALTNSFKEQLLKGGHDFTTDTFYLALYTAAADLSASTPIYTPLGEVIGTGYTAGGLQLVNLGVATGGNNAYTSFADAVWVGPIKFQVAGGLIYNASKANASVVTLNFGMTYDVNILTPYTVKFPPFTSQDAPIILGNNYYSAGAPS
jgi:hypothetical protein